MLYTQKPRTQTSNWAASSSHKSSKKRIILIFSSSLLTPSLLSICIKTLSIISYRPKNTLRPKPPSLQHSNKHTCIHIVHQTDMRAHTPERPIYWINTQHPILKVPAHQFPPHAHTHSCNYIYSTNLNYRPVSPSQV